MALAVVEALVLRAQTVFLRPLPVTEVLGRRVRLLERQSFTRAAVVGRLLT